MPATAANRRAAAAETKIVHLLTSPKRTHTGSRTGLLAGLLALAALLPVDAAKLYKWVDEDGTVRYSDRLPPERATKKHQELNRQGVVVTTTDDARSAEEIAAEAERRRREQEEAAETARLKAIQDKKDNVLLMTFSSEEELGIARDNRIDVLDSVISLIEKSISTTQEKLDQLQQSAEQNYLSKGQEVPGGLAQKIEFFTRKIESRNEQLLQKLDEKSKINAQYEADLERFRLLKAESE